MCVCVFFIQQKLVRIISIFNDGTKYTRQTTLSNIERGKEREKKRQCKKLCQTQRREHVILPVCVECIKLCLSVPFFFSSSACFLSIFFFSFSISFWVYAERVLSGLLLFFFHSPSWAFTLDLAGWVLILRRFFFLSENDNEMNNFKRLHFSFRCIRSKSHHEKWKREKTNVAIARIANGWREEVETHCP